MTSITKFCKEYCLATVLIADNKSARPYWSSLRRPHRAFNYRFEYGKGLFHFKTRIIGHSRRH